MCEAIKANGQKCSKPYRFIVNGLLREVQSLVCGQHLAGMVQELAVYNDESAKRRHPDSRFAGTVFFRKDI
jgi:hypothetical protein